MEYYQVRGKTVIMKVIIAWLVINFVKLSVCSIPILLRKEMTARNLASDRRYAARAVGLVIIAIMEPTRRL